MTHSRIIVEALVYLCLATEQQWGLVTVLVRELTAGDNKEEKRGSWSKKVHRRGRKV